MQCTFWLLFFEPARLLFFVGSFLGLVRIQVELIEQSKENEVDHSGEDGRLVVSRAALASVLHVHEAEHENNAGHKLNDLTLRHVLLARDLNLECGGKVVGVHEGVDQRIHQRAPPRTFKPLASKP